jgi:carbon storage regulator CsrA
VLVLTLRSDGCISIGDHIKIYNGEDYAVRIAIDAPREINISREEAKEKVPRKLRPKP